MVRLSTEEIFSDKNFVANFFSHVLMHAALNPLPIYI